MSETSGRSETATKQISVLGSDYDLNEIPVGRHAISAISTRLSEFFGEYIVELELVNRRGTKTRLYLSARAMKTILETRRSALANDLAGGTKGATAVVA